MGEGVGLGSSLHRWGVVLTDTLWESLRHWTMSTTVRVVSQEKGYPPKVRLLKFDTTPIHRNLLYCTEETVGHDTQTHYGTLESLLVDKSLSHIASAVILTLT